MNMIQAAVFTKLNDTKVKTEPHLDTMSLSEPLNHPISPLATNTQAEHLDVAYEMANHICKYTFEQQNEMLLRIQEQLIKHRMGRIEELEKYLYGVSVELDNARDALRSISG